MRLPAFFLIPIFSALSTFLSPCASAEGGAARALGYAWTGLYGGINAGYGSQDSDWDFGAGGSSSSSGNSGVLGLQVGYGAQLDNNLYLGLEASLDASRINGKSGCLGGQTCETHVSSLGDISARLGLTSGQALYFLKGGIAYQDTTHHIESPGADRQDNGGAALGYVVGGGVEYALMYNLTTKLEYNYLDVGSQDSLVNPGGTRISVKEPINLVKLGLNLKFE